MIRQEFDQSTKNCQNTSPILALAILSQIFNVDLNPKKDSQAEVLCEKILKYITPSGFPKDSSDIPLIRVWHFIEAVFGRNIESEYTRQ